jgi:hypothetical protein
MAPDINDPANIIWAKELYKIHVDWNEDCSYSQAQKWIDRLQGLEADADR